MAKPFFLLSTVDSNDIQTNMVYLTKRGSKKVFIQSDRNIILKWTSSEETLIK